MPTIVKCPTCGTQVEWSEKSEYRPFCSKRCQLIDLGEWASESNSIPESPMASSMSEADIDKLESMLLQQDNDFFKPH